MDTRRRKITERGEALTGRRAADVAPDPAFRAALRARLVAAAADRGEARRNPGRADGPDGSG